MPRLRLARFAALLVLGLALGNPAFGQSQCDLVAGNLITNCGFESGDFTGWIRSGDPFLSVTGFAHSGAASARANGNSSLAFISQNIATTPGADYTVSFWLVGALPNLFTSEAFQASFGGATTFFSGFPFVGWTQFSFTGRATAASTALTFGLQFAAPQGTDSGLIDDIVVLGPTATAAPEPASVVLVASGLVGVVVTASRRRRTAA